jgi:hypothetical protein
MVTGSSGNVFMISNNFLAGMAMAPLSSAISGSTVMEMVVSKSEAVIFNLLSFNSKRKFSKMGSVELLDKTPLMVCKLFNNAVLDIINFIIDYVFVDVLFAG